MNRFSKELLSETTASVLADCAFLMLDPAGELVEGDGPAVETILSFTGSVTGALRLCASRQMLVGAAADMLGGEGADAHASEEAEATLSELGNVLLGVLLARVSGGRDYPAIGLPRTQSVGSVSDAAGAVCSAVLVDMEGQCVVVSILNEAEAAA